MPSVSAGTTLSAGRSTRPGRPRTRRSRPGSTPSPAGAGPPRRPPRAAPLRLEELAHTLGMSISPVREAVRQLETLGLAVHVPHRGARVSELNIRDLYDLYEARLAPETPALRPAR